jgi:hypothetical protein
MRRLADLIRFYDILGHIEAHLRGKRSLADDRPEVIWPARASISFSSPAKTDQIRERV